MELPNNLQQPASINDEVVNTLTTFFEVDYKNNIYIKPSTFMSEMLLTTEERIDKLYKTFSRAKPLSELQLHTFTVTPDIVIFQNFKPGIFYTITLNFLNNCDISKPLKNISEPSGYFQVSVASCMFTTKVAPGMSQQYSVTFCGEEKRDYFYQLVFLTEAESIRIPAIALCDRPILTLPDHLLMPKTPVRLKSFRSINIRNISKTTGKIVLTTTPPFYVQPEQVEINPDDNICVKITFEPFKVENTKGLLVVSYGTGEKLAIRLEGDVYIINVRLEKSDIYCDDAFMGLKTYKTVKLYNDGDQIVPFKWKKTKLADDAREARKMKEAFDCMKTYESYRSRKLEEFEVIDTHGHFLIYERICKDEIEGYECEEHLMFLHPNFQILPLVGELWPKSSIEFTIVFQPESKENFEVVAYCDVLGLDQRLPLKLYGQGLGPNIVLCADTINVNRIYTRAMYEYDITFNNLGFINGTVVWTPTPTNFGGNICCFPNKIYLKPNEVQMLVMQFASSQEGKFVEEVNFEIEESKEILTLAFMGEIFCPLLEFNVSSLNFGTVSLGYPTEREIALINTAKIAVEYQLFVLKDGYEIPLSICNLKDVFMPIPTNYAKNFTIEPFEGFVQPKSKQIIKITILTNEKGNFASDLVLKMWNSDKFLKKLSIEYISQTPTLDISPSEVKIPFCFINIIYRKSVNLENKSDLYGYFYLFPFENNDSDVECTCAITRGIIHPRSTITLEFTISTTTIGENKLVIWGTIFGNDPTEFCTIKCLGQGPVLELEPEVVNFGKITLLEVATQDILVINDSPVPSFIECVLPKRSFFSVKPVQMDILANSTIKLLISAYLTIPKLYKDTLTIMVTNGEALTVTVTAIGVGTMIQSQPKLWPEFDIGTHFTHKPVVLEVNFTNKGNVQHKMFWSRNKFLKTLKEDPNVNIHSIFSIEPSYIELLPHEDVVVKLIGHSKQPCIVSEDFYCHALLEKERDKKIITSFILNGRFVNPVLEFSKKKVVIYLNIGTDGVDSSLEDTVCLKNISSLPVNVETSVAKPFYFLQNNEVVYSLKISLEDEEITKIIIGFKPFLTGRRCYSKTIDLKLKYGHPFFDVIKVTGAINYPNIKLSTNSISLRCLSSYGNLSQEILVRNISPLPVNYSVQWTLVADMLSSKQSIEFCPKSKADEDVSRDSSFVSDDESDKQEIEDISSDLGNENVDDNEKTVVSVEENSSDLDSCKPEKLPVEHVKFFMAKKILPQYHYVLIKEITYVPICIEEIISILSENQETSTKIHTLLYPIVADFHEDAESSDVIQILPEEGDLNEKDEEHLSNEIDIVPSYGFLGPYESAILTIAFHPLSSANLCATATFAVEGGASEELYVTGSCDDVSYCFSTTNLEFGRLMYFKLCTRKITLRNTGYVDIIFNAISDELPTSTSFYVGWLSVEPSSGVIAPNNSVTFDIAYYPGIPGEFNEDIKFKINLEPTVKVHLHGFAVFPQVTLNTLRPYRNIASPIIFYSALATITVDYLKTVSKIGHIYKFRQNIKEYDSLSKNSKRRLIGEGWKIYTLLDLLPSILDIDLAIERTLVHDYLESNPLILNKPIKAGSLWNCMVTPYDINLSYVVRETIVDRTITIFNYGPGTATVKYFVAKKKNLAEAGITIQFKSATLEEGKTTELYVIFSPTAKYFPVTNYDVLRSFYLQVNYGVRIPIIVRAIVVLPSLSVNHRTINFDDVPCGKCLMKTITLQNSGFVPCVWKAKVKNKRKPEAWIHKFWKTPNFYLGISEGDLDVGESCLLQIYFEPQWSKLIKAKLIINIEQNPQPVFVTLKGYGIEPAIEIIEGKVAFEPCAPYIHRYEQLFTVKNISATPVEFFFTDFDMLCDEEDFIESLIMDYYKTNRILIPPIDAGQRLPLSFYEFYYKLLDHLRETITIRSSKHKSGSHSEESGSTKDDAEVKSSKRTFSAPLSITEKRSNVTYDPIIEKSFDELHDLLNSLMKQKISENNVDSLVAFDPIEKAFLDATTPEIKDPTDMKEGVIFIFHGAPFTSNVEIASAAGLNIDLPVYSVDQLIMESMLHFDSLVALTVSETIHNAFKEVASEYDLLKRDDEDEYEELNRKIELLLSGKQKKKPRATEKGGKKRKGGDSSKSSKGTSSKESSKGSSKGSKIKKDKRDTFIGIPLNFLQTLLKMRLGLFTTGLIVESLESIFIRKPLLVFSTLLTSVENYRYIHVVILSQTYQQRKTVMENEMLEETERINRGREKRIAKLMDMTAEEVDNMSVEDLEIYKSVILPMRKAAALERKQKLKLKIQSKKIAKLRKFSKAHVEKHTKDIKVDKKGKKGKDKGSSKESKLKSSKGSSKSSKGSRKSTGSKGEKAGKKKEILSPEEKEIKSSYEAFESDLFDLLHICEYWDRRTCTLTKPIPEKKKKKAPPKSPKSKKSAQPEKTRRESAVKFDSPPVQEIKLEELTKEEIQLKREIGMPVWLFNNVHPKKSPKENVYHFLNNTPQVTEAIRYLEESINPELKEDKRLFSVLHRKTEKRLRHSSSNFFITNDIEKDDVTQSLSGSIKRSRSSKMSADSSRKKKSRKEKSSSRSKISVLSSRSRCHSRSLLSEVDMISYMTSRNVLMPDDIIKFRVTFYPTAVGEYEDHFRMELITWPRIFILDLYGACGIPTINMNPTVLFPKVIKCRNSKNKYWSCVYDEQLDEFDFGYVLNPLPANSQSRLFAKETNFKLLNNSQLICNILLTKKMGSDVYKFDENCITIEPGSHVLLPVSALPQKKQINDDEMMISIKNNPEVGVIRMACSEASLQFNITPNQLNFVHAVIGRTEKLTVSLINDSEVTVNWSIPDWESVSDYFTFASNSGAVPACTTTEIIVMYTPTIVQTVPKQTVEVQIWDEKFKSEEPIFKDYVDIMAESIEVQLSYDFDIDFGDIKYKEQLAEVLEVINNGKYNVELVVDNINEAEVKPNKFHAKIRTMVSVQTKKALLIPHRKYYLRVLFLPTKVMEFQKVPILNVKFLDQQSKGVIEESNIYITGRTFASKFEFCPATEVDFGHQLIGTEKLQTITLTNIGKFHFEYRCLTMRKYLDELAAERRAMDKPPIERTKGKKEKPPEKANKPEKPEKPEKVGKSYSKVQARSTKSLTSKSSTRSSTKSGSDQRKGGKTNKMESGAFTVAPATGIVAPKESININIYSRPKEFGQQQQSFLFFISESLSKYRFGRPFILKTNSCAPKIDFKTVETLLKTVTKVDNRNSLPPGQSVLNTSIFFQQEKELQFQSCCLNKTITVKVLIENQGTVSGYVASNLSKDDESAFSIEPELLVINPYSYGYFNISFTPYAVREFTSTVQFVNKISIPPANSVLDFGLVGEGIVPEIKILEPPYYKDFNRNILFFEPTLAGDVVEKNVSFKNIGSIPCAVILDMCETPSDCYTLLPDANTVKYLNFWDNQVAEFSKQTNLVNLKPDEAATFKVVYKGINEGNFKAQLKLHLVDNPFEEYSIYVSADTFKDGVVFEGLNSFKTELVVQTSINTNPSSKNTNQSNKNTNSLSKNMSDSTKSMVPVRNYELDFSNTPINTLQTKKFKITNLSDTDNYRFEFVGSDLLKFIPTIGHLKPLASKEVIVTFVAKDLVSIDQEKVDCNIQKIVYKKPQYEALSWDDRQTFVLWQPEMETRSRSGSSVSRDRGSRSQRSSLERQTSIESKYRHSLERLEPEVEYVPDTLQQTFIYAHLLAAYSEYKCNTESPIEMKNVFLFEKETWKIKIKNISRINLNIEWYFCEVSTDNTSLQRPCSVVHTSCKKKKETRRPQTCLLPHTSTLEIQKKHRPFHLTGQENFLYCDSPSTISRSLFSCSSSSVCGSNCSCEVDLPFTLSKYSASIPKGAICLFELCFSPKRISEYEVDLVGVIPNLNPTYKPPKLRIKASSVLPHCHFLLEPSDYLDRNRGTEECVGTNVENAKVFEIEAIGLDEPVVRSFGIVNPTNESYLYKWVPVLNDKKEVSVFHIHNPEGCVPQGKTTNITVTFLPKEVRVFEKAFQCRIEKYNLVTNFLFVGNAREANVNFNDCHLNLKPTIVKHKTFENAFLRNFENFEVAFKFKKSGLVCGREFVEVEPMSGILPPKSEKVIKVSFCTTKLGETRFYLKCKVERIKKPLPLLIMGTCYEVEPIINYLVKGGEQQTLEANKMNVIDFKNLYPRQIEEVTFKIINRGKVGFFFKWVIKDVVDGRFQFYIQPQEGFVKVDESEDTIMTLIPLMKLTIDKLAIALKIPYGPTYLINITGCVPTISFKFSFNHYNFGRCLIQSNDSSYYHTILEFSNIGDTDVILENQSDKEDFLSTNFKSHKIQTKKSKKILICFHPHQERVYNTKLLFAINSQPQFINISGEGVPLRLELVNITDKVVNLGCPLVGKTVKKTIKVVNNSKTDVSVIFNIMERLPFYQRPPKVLKPEYEQPEKEPKKTITLFKKKPKGLGDKFSLLASKASKLGGATKRTSTSSDDDDKKKKPKKLGGKSQANLNKDLKDIKSSKSKKSMIKLGKSKSRINKSSVNVRKKRRSSGARKGDADPEDAIIRREIQQSITLAPKRFTKLRPKGTMDLTIIFSPRMRLKSFVEDISYQVQDVIGNICNVKGCSHIIDFALDKTVIYFGNVIHKYTKEEKVTVANMGDTAGKYYWKFDRSTQTSFTITPMAGCIPQGEIETFTIKFHPDKIDCLFKRKVTCYITGFKTPLSIDLTGTCIKMPPPKLSLRFSCPVRETTTRTFRVHNPSNEEWTIKPQVNGDYFYATNVLTVDPRTVAECEVIYTPMETTLNKPHQGYVFLLYPDSQGLVCSLHGTTDNPLPVDQIYRTITSKTKFTEILNVENWLDKPQQFKVITTEASEGTKASTNSKESPKPSSKSTQSRSPKSSGGKQTALFKLFGNEVINVIANGVVKYPWTIYVIKEGVLSLEVKFENEKTKEYLYYIIHLTVESCTELSQVELTTCVNVPVTHRLKLENVIKKPVVFHVFDDSSVLDHDKSVTVNPYSEGYLKITFNPLMAGSSEAHLEITSPDLGTYPYTFILNALPPIPEPPMYFSAVLGTVDVKRGTLYNTTKNTATFTAAFENAEIFDLLSESLRIPAERSEDFEIIFDPHSPGEIISKVTFISTFAGMYIIPLRANALMPKPTGPFMVKPTTGVDIDFRNPFQKSRVFRFICETPLFSVKKEKDSIGSKAEYRIHVTIQSRRNLSEENKYPPTGKLVVFCEDADVADIKWTFYLQAEL